MVQLWPQHIMHARCNAMARNTARPLSACIHCCPIAQSSSTDSVKESAYERLQCDVREAHVCQLAISASVVQLTPDSNAR